jgi:serine/threonine protein kinase
MDAIRAGSLVMAIKLQPGLEPIPGYKLVSRLGGGGFGEVWKVQAPGGFFKAMKFVAGNLDRTKDAAEPAVQELNALQRILSIRHPFILSLERYDIVNGQLLIVMELADRGLHHRCKECQAAGKPGIPRDELLRYMEETAEALDFMNVQHGLQHLDIKPANLFLVQNHVKVADFGLVKNQEALQKTENDSVTFEYAAPELYLGGMSRYSDQYSLAITYQELLTGTRPFAAKTLLDWKRQHTSYPPNTAPLPKGDQDIIARALAKKPKERWPNCQEMVQALRNLGSEAPPRASSLATPGPHLSDTQTPPSATQVEVTCPSCQRKGKVPVAFQGKQVKCPGCSKPFTIPEPPPLDIPEELGLSPMDEDKEVAKAATGMEPEALAEAKCPRCGHTGYVPEKFVGRKLKCRKCAMIFIVAGTPVKIPGSKPGTSKPAGPK